MRAGRPLVGIGLMLCAMAVLPFLHVIAKHFGRQGMPVMHSIRASFMIAATGRVFAALH